MSVNWGIMAQTGQAIGNFGDFAANWLQDRRAKQDAQAFFANNPSLFGQQQPQTLASLGQPTAVQPQQSAFSPFRPAPSDGNATTTALYAGPTLGQKPATGIGGGFASEMQDKWANQPGKLIAGLMAQPSTMTPQREFSSIEPPQRSAAASPAQGVDLSRASGAIASIESDGRYDAMGPVTRTKDRAYGKYQVMGENIPQWTKRYVGRTMTPQEFINSPEAQEAVFRGEFGRLSQQYGPDGAARAWFAGEGGMNDPNRRDILGTSVADYGRKFAAAFAGSPASQPQPLANIQPMGGAPAQAPVTLARLGQPQAQFTPEQLGQMMTNPYLAPIAQQVVARQLGRDPMQQAQAAAQLEAIQLQNQQRRAEMAGEGQRLNQVDLGDKVGFVNQRGEVVRTIDKAERPIVVDNQLVNPRTGQPVNPGGQQNAPKLTEQQSKDLVYYNRGVGAEQNLAPVEQALTSFGQTSLNTIPGVGNMLTSDQFQKANQAGRDILASILRKDTGAAVTAPEMDLYGKMYLPQPGDGSEVLEQKREARQRALEAIRAGLGKAEVLAASRPKAPAQAPKLGEVQDGYRFKGGNPADPNSWVKVQ